MCNLSPYSCIQNSTSTAEICFHFKSDDLFSSKELFLLHNLVNQFQLFLRYFSNTQRPRVHLYYIPLTYTFQCTTHDDINLYFITKNVHLKCRHSVGFLCCNLLFVGLCCEISQFLWPQLIFLHRISIVQ